MTSQACCRECSLVGDRVPVWLPVRTIRSAYIEGLVLIGKGSCLTLVVQQLKSMHDARGGRLITSSEGQGAGCS